MKFRNIYQKSEENVEKALLNFWTIGNHPMRGAIKDMFQREPLMAEPVFQSMYGWQPTEDDSWKAFFLPEVIDKIGIGMQYAPYSHQANSWKTLLNESEKQSVVVTSGTGSGKTECFMYPVINDIVKNKAEGVQAIFLYPLNALMADQCNRMGELCDKFDGVKFAVYNGNTKEHIGPKTPRKENEHESQLRGRNEIRQTPPQILLSNPSMLEYMLVRGSDQTIMEKSRGNLRWIIIDEAHSYSGSSAVELKYQIRRILDAFGVDISNVRFACTSATIGGENGAESLKEFISALTGQDKNKIKVIGGSRQVPELEEKELDKLLASKNIQLLASNVMKVREQINECTGLSLRTMWVGLHGSMTDYDPITALDELDKLCELNDGRGKPVFSLRAHFHMRAINGLYTCVNPKCKCNSKNNTFGNITSFSGTRCEHCNSPMLELRQCDCGQFLISGEVASQTNLVRQNVDHKEIAMGMKIIDAEDDKVVNQPIVAKWNPFAITTIEDSYSQPIEEGHVTRYKFEKDGLGLFLRQDSNGSYVKLEVGKREIRCPICGESEGSFWYFNVPVDSLNKIVGRVLLEETSRHDQQWGKYISFTDSRQGTAISAKNFNIESERIIATAKLIKKLTDKQKEIQNSDEYKTKKANYDFLSSLGMDDNANIREQKERLLAELENIQATLSVKDASECIFDRGLFNHLKSSEEHLEAYKAAVTRSILGRRTLRKPSVESLGIIEICYKAILQIEMPSDLEKLKKYDGTSFEKQDWHNFLTIVLDFYVREHNHIQPLIPNERQYIREGNLSTPIKEFPKVNVSSNDKVLRRQHRLVLLLCAAMGINTPEELSNHIGTINSLLEAAWNSLKSSVLKKVIQNNEGYNNQDYYGNEHVGSYYLDISSESTACEVKLLTHAWQCPVTHRLLNVIFCGYSPTITGNISARNFEKFKVASEKIEMPIPISIDTSELKEWIANDPRVRNMKEMGLWSDIQDNYYLTETSYIAAEHSAQQSDERLEEYTKRFKDNNHSINVLNCSTTMEMGVDIGDIEVVLMDTIPPGAANYLQRAGRAGRKGQSKATAFTLCNASPIGMKAFHNPMWALQDANEMRMVLASPVIIQRHINSFLFHYYINENIKNFTTVINLEEFFGKDENNLSHCKHFIGELHKYATDSTLKSNFHAVFGDNISYSVSATIETITRIESEYWNGMNHLMKGYEEAANAYKSNRNDSKAERTMYAIHGQILRVRRENLLSYLSEKQFIPNANMPTGIVEFDCADRSCIKEKIDIYKKLKELKSKIEKEKNGANDRPTIDRFKQERRNLQQKLEKIEKSTIVARDVRTALNEYAPGQTIVINERNYISQGIALYDNMEGQPRIRALYHCESCGHTKYSFDEFVTTPKTCESCGKDTYVSVIPRLAKKGVMYTYAYEPIKFRTDSTADSTRTEKTDKMYFDIRAELTSLSWNKRNKIHNIDFVSQQEGEIIYYNLGLGEGFAICKKCGRSVLDTISENAPLGVHMTLDGNQCSGSIERHIAFTGRQQTCYTAMRFYKNGVLSKDEGLAISMGVILKRALVKYLHIDSNEIDFGIKNERDAVVLFIYDVNKGGCGYSMHLGDSVECQNILDIALRMMEEYSCHCENNIGDSGACSHCLIDKTTYRYRDLLSKSKAYTFLLEQKGNSISIPTEIISVSPEAKSRHESLDVILQKAALNRNISEIGICVSAKAGLEASDFLNVANPIGKALNDALHNGKTIQIYVEYNNDIDDFDTLYQLSCLEKQFINFSVMSVKSLGEYPSLMILKSDNGYKHIFTDLKSENIALSSDWGGCTNRIFEDNILPNFEETHLPNLSQVKDILSAKGRVILEGDIPNKEYSIKKIFSQGICEGIIKENKYIEYMRNILANQNVTINFSDAYVNSALAGMILTYMIEEIKTQFSCNINSVTLQLESRKRNISGGYNSYQSISRNFADEESCDVFLKELFENVLDIDYAEEPNTKHHRWLRLTSPKGTLELRPDHGIDGGWFTRVTYNDLDRGLDHSKIVVSKAGYGTADIIYYIIMTKNKN